MRKKDPRANKDNDFRRLKHYSTAVAAGKGRTSDMIGNIHVGLAAIGAAVAVGLIGMAASDAVGRNPGASTQILVQSILAIAFAEAIVFYTLFLVG
jgi:F-type H+-transporting ATPase subunit c